MKTLLLLLSISLAVNAWMDRTVRQELEEIRAQQLLDALLWREEQTPIAPAIDFSLAKNKAWEV